MGPPIPGRVRRQRVVLLQPQGPQVPQRHPPQPRRRLRLLEGHRHRQAHPRRRHRRRGRRRQEGPRLLQGPPTQGHQDQLDHARVPPRRRPARRRRQHLQGHQVPQRLHAVGRLGAVPDLQEVRPGVADGAAACRLRPSGPRRAIQRLRRRLQLLRPVEQQHLWRNDDDNHGHAAGRRPDEAPQDPVHLRALRRVRARADFRQRGRARHRTPRRPPLPEPAPVRRCRRRARHRRVLHVVVVVPGHGLRERGETQGEPGGMRRLRDHRPLTGQEAERFVLRHAAGGERLASHVVGARRPEPSAGSSVLIKLQLYWTCMGIQRDRHEKKIGRCFQDNSIIRCTIIVERVLNKQACMYTNFLLLRIFF